MADFFISYNSADEAWAKWIDGQLREAGYSTIVQAYDFRPGENFVLRMQEAAKTAKRTLALLSPEYLKASFTHPEWAAAFKKDPEGRRRLLIPVRVKECDLEGLLPQIIYIDLVGKNEAAAARELLDGFRPDIRPSRPAAFPGDTEKKDADAPRFPGALPPIWNVPFLRNRHFTGREQLLEDLRKALEPGHPAALVQTLKGLGGVGKTQLAVEFAYRHSADYEVVWWVASEEEATLSSDLTTLAMRLELVGQDHQDQNAAVNLVQRWLESNQGWLVIFDNVDDPADVEGLLPRGGSGHVLITSRRTDWDSKIDTFAVAAFTPAESLTFLQRRGIQNDAVAQQLANELGHLPLALEQAAAYIEQASLTPQQYLELFQERKRELLARGVPNDHPEAVATTWDISFHALESESPAAAALLRLCAFLAPDDIPMQLLTESAQHLPPPLDTAATDHIQLNDAIVAAQRYSLLTKADDALSMHRLVQAIVRHQFSEEERATWSIAAVAAVNSGYRYKEYELETWPFATRLLSHCQASLGHLDAEHTSEAAARLLNESSVYFWQRGLLTEARRHLERAMLIDEAIHGDSHPSVATRANNIGQILKVEGDLEGAMQWTRRAFDIDKNVFGDNHPSVATGANNIGQILQDQGDLEGAMQWTRRAFDIDKNLFGDNHPRVAIRANNIGQILQDQGDLEGAMQWTRRAFDIDQNVFGDNHPRVAIRANNIGTILRRQGHLASALKWHHRALKINQSTFGEIHPHIAYDLSNISLILERQGEIEGARQYLARSVKILEATFGRENPTTQAFRNRLTSL